MKLKKQRARQEGGLLIELMMYVVLLGIFFAVAVLTMQSTMNEDRVFDTTTRQLYYAMRRMQIMTQRGSTTGGGRVNRMDVDEHGYSYNPFKKLWGEEEKRLPPTIKITLDGPNHPNLNVDAMFGQRTLYRMYIKDTVLKRTRTYIFSQQTPRIRWEDSTR